MVVERKKFVKQAAYRRVSFSSCCLFIYILYYNIYNIHRCNL